MHKLGYALLAVALYLEAHGVIAAELTAVPFGHADLLEHSRNQLTDVNQVASGNGLDLAAATLAVFLVLGLATIVVNTI